MLIKQWPITPQKLGTWGLGKSRVVFSTKVNLLYFLYSVAGRCCLLHLRKRNCLLKTFLATLDDPDISLPVFPSRTNLKPQNISVTPKLVKKVTMKLDSSRASSPNCIPVVVQKSCEPELSYILAEPFSKCLKDSCFLDFWKDSSVVPVLKWGRVYS